MNKIQLPQESRWTKETYMLASSKLIPLLLKAETPLNAPTHLRASQLSGVKVTNRVSSVPWILSIDLSYTRPLLPNIGTKAYTTQDLPYNVIQGNDDC